MRIEKEQFDKMKQLDRIEYRQRKEIIEKYLEYNFDINKYLFIIMFIFIADMWSFLQTGYRVMESRTILVISFFIVIGILLEFITSIILLVRKKIELNKLDKEYFKIEVNK